MEEPGILIICPSNKLDAQKFYIWFFFFHEQWHKSQVATDVKFVHVGINKVHLSDCIGTWCIQYTLLFEIS